MNHDYRYSLLLVLEKLFRQRTYWKHLGKNYFFDGNEGGAKAMDVALADLDFVINKALGHLPEDFVLEVREISSAKRAEHKARKLEEYEMNFAQ